MDLWPWIIEERRDLLGTLELLGDDQWDVASLSEGWTVREVLAHLILAARPPLRRFAAGIVRARGDVDAANHRMAVEDARAPVADLLDGYRRIHTHRFGPPGFPTAAPLSDVMLHALDVRIPLGLPAERPAERYVPVLGLLLGPGGRVVAGTGRPRVRWSATDHAWVHGDGPEVRGAMADLALAASGRGARADRLAGPGAEPLRAWLG